MGNIYLLAGSNDSLNDAQSQPCHSSEIEWLEYRFYKCLTRWQKINNLFSVHGFYSAEHEIWFFKYIKPHFIGFLNYYSKRYQNLIFNPSISIEQVIFYKRELIKSEKFCCDHAEFYNYYRTGRCDLDKEYFKKRLLERNCPFENLYGGSKGLTSLKDLVVAEIITNSLYSNYLLKLLSSFNTRQGMVINMHGCASENFRNTIVSK